MRVQAIADRAQIDRDREDADRALEFYKKAREEVRMGPLTVILGLWVIKNWSNDSKELFLVELRRGLACDVFLRHPVDYTVQSIESYLQVRACAGRYQFENPGEQNDAA